MEEMRLSFKPSFPNRNRAVLHRLCIREVAAGHCATDFFGADSSLQRSSKSRTVRLEESDLLHRVDDGEELRFLVDLRSDDRRLETSAELIGEQPSAEAVRRSPVGAPARER
jgi:hypothetical protein